MTAEAIRDYYAENPEATIGGVAEALGLQPGEVHRIMDTHWVKEDGTIEEIGPGQGGGWVKPAETVLLAEESGYRWPDGELRDEPFDINNDLHRSLMGIEDPEDERSE